MRLSIQLGALLVAFVMLFAACQPGAAPTPQPTPAETPAATPAATPAETPAETPAATPAETPAETPPGEETPAATPEMTPPPGAQEGTLVIWADEVRAPVFTEIGEQFTAEYEVPVQVYQLGFGDIRDNLVLRGPAGEGPDIIVGAHDWLGQLATAGVVAPIELPANVEAGFDPVALQAFTYDGTLYGVPYASEAIALYYNTDLVPEAPQTWDELKDTARQLQADGEVEQAYCLQQGDPYHSYPILSGHGGYIFGRDDATGAYDPTDVGLDSDGGVAYANELSDLVEEGLLRTDVDYGACLSLMSEGQAAFWITGPWALGDFREMDINWAVAPIPTMDETPRPFIGVQGMMVNQFSPNALLAQSFLTEFMATDEAMQALFEADPRPPVWTATAEGVTDENVQAFIESAADGDPMPAIPEMSAVWGAWTDAINLIFQQQGDAEENIRNAAETIRTSIGAE
jgi:arabinogalactan oligomer / maltooligosaccharide transport system substrate-binding protein